MAQTPQPRGSRGKRPVPFIPQNERDEVAFELAKALREEHRLPHYREICQHHDLDVIRRLIEEVKKVPDSKIRKSKAALFAYLLNKYAGK